MRRAAAIIGLLGVVVLLFFGLGSGGDGGTYEVRGIFDNGAFMVPGEEVRVAGARVGSVGSVDVTQSSDWVNRDHSPEPGKAVVVMKIDDAGFQDFRQDASCLIRPQSLLGEKYVDCQPTEPRAPGSEPSPPLTVIPDGEPGAGERFLPLQNNGKTIDIDLVNNIMREPYADRFRLIFNDLGAGLAARGEDLDAIIQRADPALRQTDRVLAKLARQNHQLSRLAVEGDRVLVPFARERRHVAGFINNANTAAEATAERSRELEAGFQRFPEAFHQLRLTMAKLRGFSDQATPVFAEFRAGAPAITRATKALGPFAHATTPALTSLGKAAAVSRQPIVNSDPTLIKIRDLAKEGAPGTKVLADLLASLRETGFYQNFTKFLFNTTGGINGYDQFGHFLRANLQITSCTALQNFFFDSCSARFTGETPKAPTKQPPEFEAAMRKYRDLIQKQGSESATEAPGLPLDAQGDPAGGGPEPPTGGSDSAPQGGQSFGATRALLDTVLGRQSPNTSRGGRP
jgi:phospholipid/cholesterol/gamma-HCH transport system substrate-binding protein